MSRYLVIILSLVIIVFLSGCTSLLFLPKKELRFTPDDFDINYENITLNVTSKEFLHGWKLLANNQDSNKKNKKGTILFLHGNGDNLSSQMPYTVWLSQAGYDVYIFDYRGYGKSSGHPNLDITIQDVELMVSYVVKQLHVYENSNDKLILMGHSLGASMAIYALANSDYKANVKALITLAAFSDYHDVTQEVLAKSWLLWPLQWPLSFTIDNTYRPLDTVASIAPIPILILHSKTDSIIAVHHSERLYAHAKSPKSFKLIEGDHNNIFRFQNNRSILLSYLNAL